MGFTIPNEASASFADQAEIDTADINIVATGVSGNGVVSGCAITPHSTPNMSFNIAAGFIKIGRNSVSVAAGNSPTITADGTNPRYVLIEVDASGTVSNNAGTPATAPVFPTPSANKVVVAAVRVAAAATALNAGTVIDKRVMVPGGNKTHLYATDYGLGDGVTSDATALTAFFAALSNAFTQLAITPTSSTLGITGELPAGSYDGSALGHVILAPANNTGGDIRLIGQGSGATTLTLADRGSGNGCMGSKVTSTSATRSANIFTLGFGSGSIGSPLCQVGDPVVVQVKTRGVLRWAHYTCTANNFSGDYTKIQYQAFAAGSANDGCIPPLGVVYFPGTFLQPLNFKGQHRFFIEDLSLESGSATGTPMDGIGLRRSSRCHIGAGVQLLGWWSGEMINGGPMPTLLGNGAQNTDHSFSSAYYGSNSINTLIMTNTTNSYTTVGGGRDYHWNGTDMGAPALYHIVCADDGSLETADFEGADFKSGYSVIRGEGIAGIPAAEPNMIDGLSGWHKVESPGNWVWDDESKTRQAWSIQGVRQRFEAGIAINGTGNPTNFTDQPYHLTSVTITGAVMTATITETGHGIGVTTAIQIGNGSNTAFNQEGRVSAVDATGQIITVPLPQYTGANVTAGGGTATMGTIGNTRLGTLNRFEFQPDWDFIGADRFVQAAMFFDLHTLQPGVFHMTQDNGGVATAQSLPQFRIRDAEPIGGTHAVTTVTGNNFASTETEFSSRDIGKTITCANVAGGADTIASFIDISHVAMTGAVTAGTALTWSMSDVQNLDDPRVKVERGHNSWRVEFHSGADANPILAGNVVELMTSAGGTLKVQRSTGSKTKLASGIAMTGNPAGGRVSVTTNGLTGNAARIFFNSPAILVTDPGTTLTLGDDLTKLISTGVIAAGTLLADNGDGTVIAWNGTTTGLRIIGQSIKAANANFVAARLCNPYWT